MVSCGPKRSSCLRHPNIVCLPPHPSTQTMLAFNLPKAPPLYVHTYVRPANYVRLHLCVWSTQHVHHTKQECCTRAIGHGLWRHSYGKSSCRCWAEVHWVRANVFTVQIWVATDACTRLFNHYQSSLLVACLESPTGNLITVPLSYYVRGMHKRWSTDQYNHWSMHIYCTYPCLDCYMCVHCCPHYSWSAILSHCSSITITTITCSKYVFLS